MGVDDTLRLLVALAAACIPARRTIRSRSRARAATSVVEGDAVGESLPQWLFELDDAIGGHVPHFLHDSGRPMDLHQVRHLART